MVTIICENNDIDLLEHKYVEKLADEVWDGPFRVERSPLWLCSSAIALGCLLESSSSLEDPLEVRDFFHLEKRGHPRWNKLSAWGFTAWKRGTMARYISYVGVCALISAYCLWYLVSVYSKFQRLISLIIFLF